MRILQVHNFYQQAGGEDWVVENEQRLLTRAGHEVSQFTLHNNAIQQMSGLEIAAKAFWNQAAYESLRRKISQSGIDVVHVHNTFPLTSPAAYYAAHAEKTPVVQTLHNYRLICPAATLYRSGHICEDCVGKRIPFPAALHSCYRGSFPASVVTVAMLSVHRMWGTYESKVNAYIALSEFAKDKFVEGGLPEQLMRVKPNFLVEDPGIGSGYGGYALFVGRLSPEKGVLTLLDAWEKLEGRIRLQIVGTGPLQEIVAERTAEIPNATYLGRCERERVFELMRNASALMFPSEWYEGSPMSLVEAMACGTPIIAGNQGVLATIVTDGVNGHLFESGNASALAECVEKAFKNSDELARMRYPTRQYFESHFGAKDNLATLLSIYQEAIDAGNG
jgi:glycosyltransferase involved in cell wall biosynthesis